MMEIQPPFGYSTLKPLNRSDYVRLLEPGELPPFAGESQIVPLSYSEIAVAAWHFPIVFVPDTASGGYTMAALVGLDRNRNAFHREGSAGKSGWDSEAYIPAYLRRYPFCMATVTFDNKLEPDLMVCLESAHASSEPAAGAVRLFDEDGQPMPQWAAIEAFLKEYEGDLKGSQAFTAQLNELGLLELFTANIVRPDGEQQAITGMARVDEAKLTALDAETIARLHRSGQLGRIYIHLFSLQRFQSLLAREARQGGAALPVAAQEERSFEAVAAS